MATKASQKASENKLTENIGSIILGFVVVLILGGFLLNVFRGENNGEVGDAGETAEEQMGTETDGSTYTVQPGDTLWIIAEQETGSGFNWQAIAEANNIQNPDDIEEGNEIIIPDVSDEIAASEELPETGVTDESETEQTEEPTPTEQPEEVVEEQEQSTEGQYTVQRGDSLWKIAETHYNDGHRWLDIARANNLDNPDIIHTGNVLTLP